MTEIVRAVTAGTDEKSDVIISIEPGNGITIELQSVVKNQFGEAIEASIRQVLEELGVKNASVKAFDRGALDCVLRARVETAVLRGREER